MRSFSLISRITLHGFPQAMTPEGMLRVTTLPAPITEPFHIVIPPITVTFAPIHTSSSIVIGAEVPIAADLCCGSIA